MFSIDSQEITLVSRKGCTLMGQVKAEEIQTCYLVSAGIGSVEIEKRVL